MPEIDDFGVVAFAKQVVSPNLDQRPAGTDVSLLVIHGISLPPSEFHGDGIETIPVIPITVICWESGFPLIFLFAGMGGWFNLCHAQIALGMLGCRRGVVSKNVMIFPLGSNWRGRTISHTLRRNIFRYRT
jgi:hypothetical protein